MEETIINEETVPVPQPAGLILTPEAQYYLNEGAGWAKFLGIVGFIFSGFLLILAFSIGSIIAYFSKLSPNPNPIPSGFGAVFAVPYIIFAVLQFFPALYLFQFGNSAKSGVLYQDVSSITIAVGKLKSYFKFTGVLMIIALAFMLLGILGVMAGIGAMSHLR